MMLFAFNNLIILCFNTPFFWLLLFILTICSHWLFLQVKLPDFEFFSNLGDWPLEDRKLNENPLPIFSWCGSDETRDIVMPTYDVTESTLETMGRLVEKIVHLFSNPLHYEIDSHSLTMQGLKLTHFYLGCTHSPAASNPSNAEATFFQSKRVQIFLKNIIGIQ